MLFSKFISNLKPDRIEGIYFFSGAECYLHHLARQKLKETALSPGSEDFDLEVIDGEALEFDHFASVLRTLPMMSKRRVVMVKNLQKVDARLLKKIYDLLKRDLSHLILILCYEDKADLKNKPVLSDFQGAFTYVDVSPPRGAEFEKALKYISPDCEIDAKLASILAESGADLWQINIWLEQGANLVEKPGRLTLEALQDFIDLGGLASIWNLLDAVGEREVQKAQILLQDLIRNREKPSILLWHLKELFFHLNLICKIRQRGVNPEKFRAELTKKYIHDFRFNKFCQQSLNYSVAEVEQALLKIQESDLKLKTATNTDPNSLLIELLDAIVNR